MSKTTRCAQGTEGMDPYSIIDICVHIYIYRYVYTYVCSGTVIGSETHSHLQ